MRASTESSSDSDSVTRWWTHSSATESYSFFFEPSRWTRSRVTTLWSEIDARIIRGDLGALCRALDGGVDPRLADDDGDTVLHYAAYNGHADCVARLAESGADVNACNRGRRTPLNMAASSGRVAAIRALLAAGADVNLSLRTSPSWSGNAIQSPTALHWAASCKKIGAVEVLLAAGADVDAKTQEPPNANESLHSLTRDATALDQAVAQGGSFKRSSDLRPSRHWLRHNRMIPLLVRAGATIRERHAERDSYCKAVRDAGGIRAYERQHRTTLANILNRGNRLPPAVIPKIVDFWAHVGWYARRG